MDVRRFEDRFLALGVGDEVWVRVALSQAPASRELEGGAEGVDS